MKKYEEFDHTADIGLRAYGDSLTQLFVHAAQGMFSLIGEAQFTSDELRDLRLEIAPEQTDDPAAPNSWESELLIFWLQRLLKEFSLTSFFPVQYDLGISSRRCVATMRGGVFDLRRHVFFTEIKAVTWHGLKVGRMNDGWEAQIIFDV
jgi:protein archease